jgi:hypothetical protein
MAEIALGVGLIFGFSFYHLFMAPIVARRAAILGIQMAARDLRAWVEGLPPGLKQDVELSMATAASLAEASKAEGRGT